MSEIEDRRQRAFEAFADEITNGERPTMAAKEAIEVATRVTITDDLIATMDPAIGNRETRLRAAFTAAGFQIEAVIAHYGDDTLLPICEYDANRKLCVTFNVEDATCVHCIDCIASREGGS